MSLRGAAWVKALGRRGNLVAMQIGHALATRLPRCARNDMVFISLFRQLSSPNACRLQPRGNYQAASGRRGKSRPKDRAG
jgi:hypothetical protein